MGSGASALEAGTALEALIGQARNEESAAACRCGSVGDQSNEPTWNMADWLRSLKLHEKLAEELCKQLEVADDPDLQLALLRKLGRSGSRDLVLSVLRDGSVLEALADEIYQGAKVLTEAGAATSDEMNSKFMQESGTYGLSYGDLSTFFSGLEGLAGSPDVKFKEAMEQEHCKAADSMSEFTAGNYRITTTPRVEWHFVSHPEDGPGQVGLQQWPEEDGLPGEMRGREAKAPDYFKQGLADLNNLLREAKEPEVLLDEQIGLRLYTGPMFVKYNGTLRGFASEFMRKKWDELCLGNKYVTTLHIINSGIVKSGKIMTATKVYRGISGGLLPQEFWEANKYNIRGGVEYAFMSTTLEKSVAMQYASSGAVGTVFEIQMGMIDRGASLQWISQYPQEQEICFAPLTGLEVRSKRVEGSALVVEVRLNINLSSLTIEQVLAKRKKVVTDMCRNLKLEMGEMFGRSSWRELLGVAEPERKAIITALKQPALHIHETIEQRSADSFNDDPLFLKCITEVLAENAKMRVPTMQVLMSAAQLLDSTNQGEAAGVLRQQAEGLKAYSEWTKEEVFQRTWDLLICPADPDVDAMAKEVGALLHSCPHITEIGLLRKCTASPSIALFRAMETNTTITKMRWNQPASDDAHHAIAKMLEANRTLKHLNCESANIDEAGGILIAKAMEKNTTLTFLKFHGNTNLLTTHASAVAWASAIQKNTGLSQLELSYTSCHGGSLKDENAALVFKGLAANTSLQRFTMGEARYYGELAGTACAEALEANKTLRDLGVGPCVNFTEEVRKRIHNIVLGRGATELSVSIKL